MALSYPENTVWYIEARPWQGPDKDKPGFALVEPTSMGSGVVVTFTRTAADDERRIRTYLLTCAHVVRDRKDRLLEDIICYPPGKGFIGTAEKFRRSGTFENSSVRVASVSKYSPCKGAPVSRPEHLRNNPASDWVLLEIADPSFRYQPSVQALLREDELPAGATLRVIGFPGGAFDWKNGDIVKSIELKGSCPDMHSASGILVYRRAWERGEETGMSGSGIFDDDGNFVGIHRSNADVVIKQSGIQLAEIARYLVVTYQLKFSGSLSSKHRKNWRPAATRAFLTVVVCISLSFIAFGPWQQEAVPIKDLEEEVPLVNDYRRVRGFSVTPEKSILSLDYPERTIWYIEARLWQGDRNNPDFASTEAASIGSGVVITLIKVQSTGKRVFHSYILTSAQVVRNENDELLEDIICYPPDMGFVGTSGNNRRSGEGIAKARAAVVSKYSPCRGKRSSRPEALKKDPALDWVLLKINHLSFHHQPSAIVVHEKDLLADQPFRVIGFPGGAVAWSDGDIVSATAAMNFRHRYSNSGMIYFEGPEETRHGMNGGGIFNDDGFLVGIHLVHNFASMKTVGIRLDAIASYLDKNYQLEFSEN
jgi:hypothetical protein